MSDLTWQARTLGDWLEQAAVFHVMIQLDTRADFSAISPTALRDLLFATWPERLLAEVRTIDLREVGSTYVRHVAYLPLVDGKGCSPPHTNVDERARRDQYWYLRPADEHLFDDYHDETDDERELREDTYRLEDESGRRYSILDAYRSAVSSFRALARPGVTLSKEQLDYLRRIVQHPPSWPSTTE